MFLYQRYHSEGQYIAKGEEEELENEKDDTCVGGQVRRYV